MERRGLGPQRHQARRQQDADHGADAVADVAQRGQPATPAQLKPVGKASSVLGERPDEPFDEIETFPWEENDQLFLYTDGLIDCLFDGKELFSRRSLVHLLTKHAHLKGDALIQEIIRTRRSMIGNIPQEDDVTAVVCLRSPPRKTTDPANSGGQA